MKKIIKETGDDFPFDWANLYSYRDSKAYRKEIYLKSQDKIVEDLILMFYSLFDSYKNNLLVFNRSWWDFCLDTWDLKNDDYDYGLEGKSLETQEYLKLLIESQVKTNYTGCCTCDDWDKFLNVILTCLVNHKAPYSPIFCDRENEYFFYFHYTGSIGIYFKEENDVVRQILSNGCEKYLLED